MKIQIKNLHAEVSVGVYEWEKNTPRRVEVTLAIQYGAKAATDTDDVKNALDYAAVEQCVLAIGKRRHFNLIESLVAEIGLGILAAFPLAGQVDVEVEKPGALEHAQRVSVSEVFRR